MNWFSSISLILDKWKSYAYFFLLNHLRYTKMPHWEGCWDSICIIDKHEEQVLSESIPCLVCFHLVVDLRHSILLARILTISSSRPIIVWFPLLANLVKCQLSSPAGSLANCLLPGKSLSAQKIVNPYCLMPLLSLKFSLLFLFSSFKINYVREIWL